MNPKLIDTLTFCKRIGALKLGFDPVKSTLEHGQAKLVLLAKDLSSKSRDSVLRICQQDGCPAALLPLQMDEIWFLVGKRSGILAECWLRLLTALSNRPVFLQMVYWWIAFLMS